MAAFNPWIVASGYSFGTFPEQVSVNLPLPLVPAAGYGGLPPLSYDGTNHHPTALLRNSAGAPFVRKSTVTSYTDGIHTMRTDLPNARTVSNLVVYDPVDQGQGLDPTGYSGFMYAWGQFITHELEFARQGTGNIDVVVPAGDTNLTPGSHIPVTRNAVAPGTGTDPQHPALPINDVTGWVDGTVIYGLAYPPGVPQGPTVFANPVTLREGGAVATTGKLLTSSNGQYAPVVGGSYKFGDPRGTENPDLTSIQTLMIREHNWHVDRLKTLHPTWTGEQLYQRARSIVIAEEQVITYKEWLPKVLGDNAIPAYTGFKSNVDASISIEFSAAAMRFGHSIVSDAQDRVDEQGNVTEALTLAQAFFLTPAQFERNGGADGFLRKLASDIMNKLDVHIIEDLRNLLDDPPAALDLAATNIQRGRDLGLPSLNQMRTALGLTPYTAFNQITSDTIVSTALQLAYTNINNIDLWVGGLAENRVAGAMVGETFRTIMIEQFTKLRDGDNQWYENQPWAPGDITWLRNTTLADIILRNTDTIKIQSDVFVAVERADLISGVVTSAVARTNSVDIPATNTFPFNLNVISGELPPGLILQGNTIIGSPYITQVTPTYNFCIRASNGVSISDRTFKMTVYTNAVPEFITPAGELPVGIGGQLYALDSTYINYQIDAYDYNTSTGQPLTYFIAQDDGELPPGVTLSPTGLISGFIRPSLLISLGDGNGNFDESLFDKIGFDFGKTPTNGFDSYNYDNVFYDYFATNVQPASLSANYQFRVTLTDGVNLAQRIFRIFVAGTDAFRADSTILDGFAGEFNASASYVRTPVWITESNLGTFRANNYITIPMAMYDSVSVEFGIVDATKLPPGMYFDPNTGDLYGTVPYQPSVSKTYTFTLTATRIEGTESVTATKTFTMGILGLITSQITWKTSNNLGIVPANYISTLTVEATSNVPGSVISYVLSKGRLPYGLTLNNDGEIIGIPNQFGAAVAVYDGGFDVTTTQSTLDGGSASNTSTTRVNGGVSTVLTTAPGLITFDRGTTTFDRGTSTFERVYKFTITAQDQYGYSATTRDFSITLATPNTTTYSNITAKPLLVPGQRLLWKDFINNTTIFPSTDIYRPNDPNFGLRTDITMLVYAGIETDVAAAYVGAMGLGIKKKRFQFGSVKNAIAVDTNTNQPVYEVVYVQMADPLESNGKHLPLSIKTTNPASTAITTDTSNSIWSLNLSDLIVASPTASRPESVITADSTGYQASNPNIDTYYPNSITNWQQRISTVGMSERNYLPLWMRSIPSGSREELGYVLCVPLCFCKVGTSATILENIRVLSGFDFKSIDFTVDRFTISAVLDSSDDVIQSDKYLVFRNDRITV